MAARPKASTSRRTAKTPSAAETGLAIWRDLRTRGGLDLRRPRRGQCAGYDVPLEDKINSILFPTSKRNLEGNLRNDPRKPEEFLAAFFAALRPFSLMIGETLAFFENANAKYGERNMKIIFNFRKGHELGLDLQHFREVERYLHRVTKLSSRWSWSSPEMFRVVSEFRGPLPVSREYPATTDPSMREWMARYGKPNWLDPPPIPRSGVPALDILVERCDRLLADYIVACRSLATDRDAFRIVREQASLILSDRSKSDAATIEKAEYAYSVALPDTDFWAENLAEAASYASEIVHRQSAGERAKTLDQLIAPVRDALDAIYLGSKTVQAWQQDYRDILNLPIWRRRHELYAVWIGARIAAALGELESEFHVEDGVLKFPFSGAQLATMWSRGRGTYMFWTELRSRLATTAKSGRKAIQPDYRILKMPFEPVRGTVLVVECKQYRRSSTGNFAAALNDYALGCPNAKVVLVNNGPIGNAVVTAVRHSHLDRTHALGDVRPDEPEKVTAFDAVVREAVLGRRESMACTDENRMTALIWSKDSRFEDLDLHVIVRDRRSGVATAVGYNSCGSLGAYPWVQLSGDVRSRPGVETVHIGQWMDAIYEIYVHNYSDDACPNQSGVSLYVRVRSTGKDLPIFPAPTRDTGRCWFVCRIDGVTGEIQRVNKVLADVARIAGETS